MMKVLLCRRRSSPLLRIARSRWSSPSSTAPRVIARDIRRDYSPRCGSMYMPAWQARRLSCSTWSAHRSNRCDLGDYCVISRRIFARACPRFKQIGKKAAWLYDLSGVSEYKEEAEVLFPPYSEFEVIEEPKEERGVMQAPRRVSRRISRRRKYRRMSRRASSRRISRRISRLGAHQAGGPAADQAA